MKIEDIIIVLDNANKLRDECQDQLHEYVNNPFIPLEKRMEVWIKHLVKGVRPQ